MPKNNQKGIIHIFLLLFLIVSIGVGVYLVNQKTNLFPKAAQETNVAVITDLTNQLLQATGGGKTDISLSTQPSSTEMTNLANIATRRKAELLKLLDQDPLEFSKQAKLYDKRHLFPKELANDLEQLVMDKGKFLILHFDDFKNKKSTQEYYFESAGIEKIKDPKEKAKKRFKLRLPGAQAPKAKSGSTVQLSGISLDQQIALSSPQTAGNSLSTFNVLAQPASQKPLTSAKVAALLVRFQDSPATPPFTKVQTEDALIHSNDSLKKYYEETSYGNLSPSIDVFDWITIPYTISYFTGCPTFELANYAKVELSKAGINLDIYDYEMYITSDRSPGCSWSGAAGRRVSFIYANIIHSVLSHEFGHTLGWHHANKLACPPKYIDNYANCINGRVGLEYEDRYDVMGSGLHQNNPSHKIAAGWIPQLKIATVTANGTYTIAPLEDINGSTLVLRIYKADTNEYYDIDYRQRIGYFDRNITTDVFLTEPNGAFIRISEPDPDAWMQTALIDMTPLNTMDPKDAFNEPLSDGMEFYDPVNDIRIKQLSHDRSGVKLQISGNFSAGDCKSVSLSAFPAGSQKLGQPVTLVASAAGCPLPEYRWWILPLGGTWAPLTNSYSNSATFNWDTLGANIGDYKLGVWARNAGSTDQLQTSAALDYTLKDCTTPILQYSTSPSSSIINLTASSSCAGGTPQYRWWMMPPGGTWQPLTTTYSASSSYSWDTNGLTPGLYQVGVWVDTRGNPDVLQTSSAIGVTVAKSVYDCSSVTITASNPSPQNTGGNYQFSASSTCTNNSAEYAWFTRHIPDGKWVIMNTNIEPGSGNVTWSSNSTIAWNTQNLPIGTYQVGIWARAAGSNSPTLQATSAIDYVLQSANPNCTSISLKSDLASPIKIGSTVNFSSKPVCNTTYQFRWWVLPPGGTWTVVNDWSTNSTFSWTTTGLKPGKYLVDVWVKADGSTKAFDTESYLTFDVQ